MKIDDITSWAKEFLLKDGKHGPTLFVETDKPQMVIAGLADMPGTPEMRLPFFLALGRRFAADHPGEHLREVAFIVMSWASKQLPGQPAPKHRPSQDPNRMEVLMISHLTMDADDALKFDGQLVEIIRDNRGKLRDLYHLPDTVLDASNPMLTAFVLGFQHPQWSVSQAMRVMQDMRGPA